MTDLSKALELAKCALADDWHPNIRDAAQELARAVIELHAARPTKSLCVECGPDVTVDEDGCCVMCGGGAVGTWLWKTYGVDDGASR